MEQVEIAVIGAGVIGLAIARALARDGHEVVVLEAASSFGHETSSRSSEVIHAGIYYEPDSLKARLCVEGRERLYAYCAQCGIPYQRCGKLIIACSDSQRSELTRIAANASANGVELIPLDRSSVQSLEPQLSCSAGLLSSATGIVDSHQYMLALLGEAESSGASFAFRSKVARMSLSTHGVEIAVNGEARSVAASLVINSAGLDAVAVAAAIDGFPRDLLPSQWFAKGSYFWLNGRAPFERLVYPVPEPGGLGVHLTLDLAGRGRFGPDVEWLREPDDRAENLRTSEPAPSPNRDYQVDPRRAVGFYDAIRRYWPGLPEASLMPGYAGIRPKISGPGQPAADFMIEGPADHGLPVVNLFGIESPGLTASLAIGEYVAEIARSWC